jgi:hypothetical protein
MKVTINWKFIKKYWIVPLLILKSFFLAITQLAWGLVSLGLFGWVMLYIKNEYPLVNLPDITGFLSLAINLIIDNVTLFFWIFFIIYVYFEFLELKIKSLEVKNK